MIHNWLERTELLLGAEKLECLTKKNVLVVGLGGVGAYAAEMICRAGVGKMTIVDGDIVSESNMNRQLAALHTNIGKLKAEVMAERLKQINPDIQLQVISEYIRDEYMKDILDKDFDYVVDAIDTLSPKIFLIFHSLQRGFKIISSMGAGGKMNPSMVELTDISKSYNCKLARILRKKLRKLGVSHGFPVVFSPEGVDKSAVIETLGEQNKKSNVGTISYMPALFGIFCASKVIGDLIDIENEKKSTTVI